MRSKSHAPQLLFPLDSFRCGRVLLSRTRILMVLLIFLLSSAETIRAQDSSNRSELWPEIDVYVEVKPKVRLHFLATVSKAIEDGEDFNPRAFEAMIGANVD